MVYVPDDNFEKYLTDIKFDYGEPNDSVPIAKIKSCSSLSIQNMNIKDLTGIEYFTEIDRLECSNNQIEQLNLSNNNLLRVLRCDNNKLQSINLLGNETITFFNCSYNELSNLDVKTNIHLYDFNCGHNYLKELDVSGISNLTFMYCNDNLLEKFIVKEVRPIVIDARNNSNLTCIEYDNPSEAENNSKWKIDSWAGYSENCTYDFRRTYISDDNFEQALIDLGYDSGELDDSVLTANIIEINDLNISNRNISSLGGIEEFENLYSIDCSNNTINQLNLNNNKQLTSVVCRNNQILEL
jgi:Leucine-rich repeat (LRR) protein